MHIHVLLQSHRRAPRAAAHAQHPAPAPACPCELSNFPSRQGFHLQLGTSLPTKPKSCRSAPSATGQRGSYHGASVSSSISGGERAAHPRAAFELRTAPASQGLQQPGNDI